MTYTVTIPNAGQSPGLFPAQANTNWQRLLDVISGDHNFPLTSAANQGVHNKVTFINQNSVAIPAGANSVLYSQQTDGYPELYFYNGTITSKLTTNVLRVVGSATLGTTNPSYYSIIFSDPGYEYTASVFTYINNSTSSAFYAVWKLTSTYKALALSSTTVPIPTLDFDGANLRIKNNSPTSQTVKWSLMINRTS